MFTLNQIKETHSKVKSGADFPGYIQDLIHLGVSSYETYVKDGHSTFYGKDNFNLSSPAKYHPIEIARQSHAEQFQSDLKSHQLGKTDFLSFCNDCAKSGIEKWVSDLSKMTCTYYNISNEVVLQELIPGK